MRKDDLNLAHLTKNYQVDLEDLTLTGCLLVLVTIPVVFGAGLLIASFLPQEGAGPSWNTRAIANIGAPAAALGVAFFWMGARLLGRFGYRVQRQRGEPKILVLSFGIFLTALGLTASVLSLASYALRGEVHALMVGLGIGGGLFIVAGIHLVCKAVKSVRAEKAINALLESEETAEATRIVEDIVENSKRSGSSRSFGHKDLPERRSPL